MASPYALTIVILSTCVLHVILPVSSFRCPNEIISVEEGSRQVINCSISLTGSTDVYWYTGPNTQSIPIVQILDGVKKVLPDEKQHYNISDDGSLIIKNVGRDQEGPYTILHYINDDFTEQDTVIIKIKDKGAVTDIPTHPACPIISQCDPCENCAIEATTNLTTVTCSIQSITTEKILPVWTYSNGTMIENRTNEQLLSDDEINISVSLDIQSLNCGLTVLVCSGLQGNNTLLTNAIVNISYVGCSEFQTTLPGNLATIILICGIAFILLVICPISLYYGRRYKGSKNPQEDSQASEIQLFLDGIAALRKAYGNTVTSELLPEIQMHLTSLNEDVKQISSTEFFNSSVYMSMERVLFVGEHGSGKTTIVKHVALKWSQGNSDEILFFIDMEKLNSNADIAEEICKQLLNDCRYSREDVSAILESENCWLIFDGSNELLNLEMWKENPDANVKEFLNTVDVLSPTSVSTYTVLNNYHQQPGPFYQ